MTNIYHTPTATLLDEVIEHLTRCVEKTQCGYSSGYPSLDESLGGVGFEKGQLYVVGSRPSMGKTMLALNILVNQLKQLEPNEVLVYVSTCDSATVLMQKILSIVFDMDLVSIQMGNLAKKDVESIAGSSILNRIKECVVMCQKDSISFADCRQLIAAIEKDGKVVRMMTIDTLQGMQTDSSFNREQGIGSLLKELRVIAIQKQFPLLLLSDVSRRVEYREGPKIPLLKDLKDSRLIADHVDHLYFVLRPMYYEVPDEPIVASDEMHLICKKNMYGPLGVVALEVDLKKQKIMSATTYKTYKQ